MIRKPADLGITPVRAMYPYEEYLLKNVPTRTKMKAIVNKHRPSFKNFCNEQSEVSSS